VNTFQDRLRSRQVGAAGEYDSDVGVLAREAHSGCLGRLDGADASVVRARETDADAKCHDPHDTEAVPEPVIALFGPTGVGKTDVALALARRLREQGSRPVAVSADALQVYAGLELLTGVATEAQQRVLEHRLVSFLPVDARFSVGEYAALAHAQIDELLAEGATPIVIGGTGLYLRAALTALALRPPPQAGARERWNAELERSGPEALHALLEQRAPWAAAGIDPADRHRLVRALELEEIGALEPPEGDSQLWSDDVRHPTRLVGLTMERGELYARIDRRIDAMVAAGVIEEVRAAHRAGASSTARAALGFEELLAGDIDAMKRRTRNYAKRQLTWMRKLAGVRLVDATGRGADELAAALQ
jgi:tRNA dimethylallyltransferase